MSRRDEAHEPWMTDAAGFGRERQDRGYAGRGPRGYTRSDDRLREDICERLSAHPLIDASEIEVNVANGEVTLEGTVESRRVRHMAEDVCDSVMGVRDIHNNLRVNRQMRRDPESPTGRPPITHTEH
ncbi:MAG: BON domain-containing protein [Acidobacteria bacterium]|nr:BON domain-containing protein [Acidobacteriota bacterium]